MKFTFLPQPRQVIDKGGELPVAVLDNVTAVIGDGVAVHSEGYCLEITQEGVKIHAADAPGKFYAECTLEQICRQARRQGSVPRMVINDYPALPVRGISLDLSRDRIPNMAELKRQIDMAAHWKLNAVMFYCEHVYAYKGAEEVWKDASPFTAGDIRELREFCEARFMRLDPNQQSFGHMHKWLHVDKFRPLAECPEGFRNNWSLDDSDPFSLCPTDPKSIEFIDDLWGQFLPNFKGDIFQVGCDETSDLGKGRSKEACEKYGVGRVYLDFVKKLDELAQNKYHKRIVVDADILHLHPDLIPEIPRSAIIQDWAYRPDYDFCQFSRQLKELGFDFVLMCSDSSYTSFNGRTYRWRENIRHLVEAAVKYEPLAVYISEFGDSGHWNELVTAIPGNAYFAAMCWCPETNRNADLATALDEFAFKPGSGAADLLMDCGRPYAHIAEPNASDLLWLFMTCERYNLQRDIMAQNMNVDKIARIQDDLDDLLCRLERMSKDAFAPRDFLALTSHARWMRLAADVVRECLMAGCVCGPELPRESRLGYAARFDEISVELLKLRDDGTFLPGGRSEALRWLRSFRLILCGQDV